jgi:hypothetical protein
MTKHRFEQVTSAPDLRPAASGARLAPMDIVTAALDFGASFGIVTACAAPVVYIAQWPWLSAPTAGLAVAAWRYFDGIWFARRLLLPPPVVMEMAAPPAPAPSGLRVDLRTSDRTWEYVDLPGAPAALQKLAAAVHGGAAFTERTAADAGLTQEEFGDLRDDFVRRGLARWKHPQRRQQGVTLTQGGRTLIREMAKY